MAFGFSIPAMGSQDDAFGLSPDMLAAIRQMNAAPPAAATAGVAQQAASAPLGLSGPAPQPAAASVSLPTISVETPKQQAGGGVQQSGSGFGGSSLADRIVGAESGGNASAKNPNSSATGAGQFIDSTWLSMIGKYRPDLAGLPQSQILAMRNDPALSRQMVDAYAGENGAKLKAAGLPDNDGNRYLGHFLGPGGMTSVLSADPSTPVSQVLQAGQISANPFLRGMTAGQLTDWAARKVGGSAPTMTMPGGSSAPAAFGLGGVSQGAGAGSVLPFGGNIATSPDTPSSLGAGPIPGSGNADPNQGGGQGKGSQKQNGGPSPMQFRTVKPRPFGFFQPMQFAGQTKGQ